jgi:hypothetical protein
MQLRQPRLAFALVQVSWGGAARKKNQSICAEYPYIWTEEKLMILPHRYSQLQSSQSRPVLLYLPHWVGSGLLIPIGIPQGTLSGWAPWAAPTADLLTKYMRTPLGYTCRTQPVLKGTACSRLPPETPSTGRLCSMLPQQPLCRRSARCLVLIPGHD